MCNTNTYIFYLLNHHQHYFNKHTLHNKLKRRLERIFSNIFVDSNRVKKARQVQKMFEVAEK